MLSLGILFLVFIVSITIGNSVFILCLVIKATYESYVFKRGKKIYSGSGMGRLSCTQARVASHRATNASLVPVQRAFLSFHLLKPDPLTFFLLGGIEGLGAQFAIKENRVIADFNDKHQKAMAGVRELKTS